MSSVAYNDNLEFISRFVSENLGLSFPKSKFKDLDHSLKLICREMEFKNLEDLTDWILNSPNTREKIENLSSYLTVGETYFFREPAMFEVLEKKILPALIESRRYKDKRIRIWSAGCASGEEPYTISILLHQLLPDIDDWNITLLATDINPRFLNKASRGIYTPWSFRNVPEWSIKKYFKEIESKKYKISSKIRRSVKFAHINLAEDVYPSLINNTNAMDLIFCRNVLLYFNTENRNKVLNKLAHSLLDNGCLVLGAVESAAYELKVLSQEQYGENFYFIKTTPVLCNDVLSEKRALTDLPVRKPSKQISPQKSLSKKELKAEKEKVTSYFEKGEYGVSAIKAESLLKLMPEDIQLMSLAAKAFANQGNFKHALFWLSNAQETEKLNPYIYYLVATIYLEQGEKEAALNEFRKAIYLNPDFIMAHFLTGHIYFQEENMNLAEVYFENAVKQLKKLKPEEMVPFSEGLTAKRLLNLMRELFVQKENAA